MKDKTMVREGNARKGTIVDKGFMSEYYERMYEDPIHESMSGNEEYDEYSQKALQMSEKLAQALDSETRDLFEDYCDCVYGMMSCVAKGMFLKGAEDRERMLR